MPVSAPSTHAAIRPALLFVLTAMIGLQALSTDLYLPSLPAIGEHFDVTPVAVQSTLSVFIAAFAVAQLLVGPMSDRFGRRPMVLGGLALYVLASVAGALAPSLELLVAARFAQAIGLCCTVLCARAVVRDLYEPDAGTRVMARALGWMTMVTLLGPVAGGLLQATFGWRAAFAALAAAGAVVGLAAAAQLRESNRHPNPAATRLGPLLANYAAIARDAEFRGFALAVTGSYGCLFTFISGSSLVLIRGLGLSPAQYGITFGLVTLGFLPGTLLARRLQPRLGLRRTALVGAGVLAAAGTSMILLALAGVHSLAAVVAPTVFVLVGHGIMQPTCQMGAIGPFPRSAGAAAALLGFVMFVGAALIGWVLGATQDGSTMPPAAMTFAVSLLTLVAAMRLARVPHAQAATPS